MSLRQQTITGVFWSSIEIFGPLVIQFIINIILARLLLPADFGIIAMLYVFTAMGAILIDAGFGNALVREKQVDNLDYSSVFYFNLFLGIIIYLFFFIISPNIASFFKIPELEKIAKYIFLIFPIRSIGLIQTTILTRDLNFKTSAKVSTVATLISGLVGIFLAYMGYGVWALVYQIILSALLKSVFLWIFNSWRPVLRFNFYTIKRLFSFSMNLMATNFIVVLFNNLYTIIIGKFYPLNEVGYYNQAKKISEIPNQTITTVVQNVTYPILSQVQDDNINLKKGYRKIIMMVLFFNFPMMFGLLVMAEDLIYLLLTEKWMPAVPYFQLLCIYGAFFPLHSININILKVKGKGKKLLSLEILRRTIMIVAIIITLNKGIIPLLVGNIIASLISILINMYYCGKEIKFSLTEQIKDLMPYFLISMTMSSIMWISTFWSNLEPILNLIIQLAVAIFIYISLNKILKLGAFKELKNTIIEYLK